MKDKEIIEEMAKVIARVLFEIRQDMTSVIRYIRHEVDKEKELYSNFTLGQFIDRHLKYRQLADETSRNILKNLNENHKLKEIENWCVNIARNGMPEDSVVDTPTIQCETYSQNDSVVLSMEEYEKYQSFKNGDYCATKCDIHELSFNQMNKISELENENEKLKKEIKNPNEVFEDRERFRARNEELKGITEQLRKEIIKLSQELVNSRKETAEKIKDLIKTFCPDKKFVETISHIISERFGVKIKE